MNNYFRLTRYFTVTSLVAFGVVAATLMYFEHRQSSFFQEVQSNEAQMLSGIQSDFVTRADAVARRDLLAVNEQGNVNLTRLFSNALWASDLTPYFGEIGSVDFAPCRAMADGVDAQGKAGATPEKKACFKQVGEKLKALKSFAPLDARVREAMQGSTIFKIKVYDLSGITVYSTELAQVGEDKSGNGGWKSAARDGKAISELTFRDKFSALQGVVENRDLIASYLPVIEPGTQKIVGVFEVYADVTPFLGQIKATSGEFKQVAQANQTRLAEQAALNHLKVQNSSNQQLGIVAGLLALLYVVLLSIVRRAQTVIERQARESDATKQRLAQSEKMTSLGHMVASVAHQLTTPLAFSKSNVAMALQALNEMAPGIRNAQRAPDRVTAEATVMEASRPLALDADAHRKQLRQVPDQLHLTQNLLGDVRVGLDQMTELVDNLRSFTRPDRGCTSEIDLNTTLASVIYIARAVISPKIRVVQKFSELPRLACVVSQLNQVFLNLIMNAAQAIDGSGQVTVSTVAQGGCVRISIEDTGSGIHDDVLPRIFDPYFTTRPAGTGSGLGLSIAKDIVVNHGGTLSVETRVGRGTTFHIELPIPSAQPT